MKKKLLISLPILLAAGLFWKYFLTSATPKGQGPLIVLTSPTDIERVKAVFNGHKDKKRVIALLSPT